VAESLPSLVWSSGADGACDYVNRQWVEYTGVPASEQLGLEWLRQVHPMDRNRVREEWQEALRSGTPLDTAFRLRSVHGAYRWFKSLAVPIRDPQDAIVKWYGTNTDVDDLKRAEGSLARFVAVLETIREGFVAFDDGMKVTFFNSAAERMLEQKRSDTFGKRLSEAFPELKGSEFEIRVGRAVRDKFPASFELEFHLRGEGFRARVYPQRSPDGASVFFERTVEADAVRTMAREGAGGEIS